MGNRRIEKVPPGMSTRKFIEASKRRGRIVEAIGPDGSAITRDMEGTAGKGAGRSARRSIFGIRGRTGGKG